MFFLNVIYCYQTNKVEFLSVIPLRKLTMVLPQIKPKNYVYHSLTIVELTL